jgi:uncharacterized lipoprotein YddW (UPF0748 family)
MSMISSAISALEVLPMRRIGLALITLGVVALLACAVPLETSTEAMPAPEEPAVGFWVRLTYDEAADAQMWDELVQAGATDLFVETFYHGFVIYPESAIFEQRPELVGTDPLRQAIDEAHARGIRLHAWVECLQWGPDYERYPQIPRNRFAGQVDDWLCRDIEGAPHSSFYVSPGNREVVDKVTRLCLDIAHRQRDIDGINLDYIRWPEEHEAWYDAANVGSFLAAGGADPRTDRSEENLGAFQRHSAEQVTHLVRTISTTVRGVFPGVMLSAAVFAGAPDSDDTWFKAQDWPRWMNEGLIDLLTPMCYAYSPEGIVAEVQRAMEPVEDTGGAVWAGLAVKVGTPHPPAVEQLDAVQGLGLGGVVFFSHGWMAERPEEFAEIGAWFVENDL